MARTADISAASLASVADISAASLASVALVAGQTSPLLNDAGEELTDALGDVLTINAPSMHSASVTVTEVI